MPIGFVGMTGVRPEGGDRAAARVIGAQRLVDSARHAETDDERLWTPIKAAGAGDGNTTALGGTLEQVAETPRRPEA